VSYGADRHKAESILLEVARMHTIEMSQIGQEALAEMRRRYFMELVTTEQRLLAPD